MAYQSRAMKALGMCCHPTTTGHHAEGCDYWNAPGPAEQPKSPALTLTARFAIARRTAFEAENEWKRVTSISHYMGEHEYRRYAPIVHAALNRWRLAAVAAEDARLLMVHECIRDEGFTPPPPVPFVSAPQCQGKLSDNR